MLRLAAAALALARSGPLLASCAHLACLLILMFDQHPECAELLAFAQAGRVCYVQGVVLKTPEPALLTPGPALLTPQPALLTPEPALLTPEPALLTPEPALLTPEPVLLTPEPALLTHEPVLLTPEPALLTHEPALLAGPQASQMCVVSYALCIASSWSVQSSMFAL